MMQVYGGKAFREELKGIIRDVRVTWLLEELGVPYERISLDPKKGENKTEAYLKLNPTGKVPTLVDGDTVLFESAAICEYLAQKHARFIPATGSKDYYLCKQWAYFVVTNVEPQCGRVFGADIVMEKDETTKEIRKLAAEALPRLLGALDKHFAKNTYFIGESFTIADIFLVTPLRSIEHTTILSDYPNVKRMYETCTKRPAYQKAVARNGL